MPRIDLYTKTVLTAIAVFVGVVALRPVVVPAPVKAQSDYSWLYVEPGTTAVRKPDGTSQQEGKVFIDLRTGEAYGFPTMSSTPYPVDSTNTKPPVSEPVYLGRFNLANMRPK